jgi:signal peptidase I
VGRSKNKGKQAAEPRQKSLFREYLEAAIIAVLLALFIRAFVVQAFKIPSGSMKPTLLIGDHILVNKFIYGVKIPFTDHYILQIKKPKRGDIVVFKLPRN